MAFKDLSFNKQAYIIYTINGLIVGLLGLIIIASSGEIALGIIFFFLIIVVPSNLSYVLFRVTLKDIEKRDAFSFGCFDMLNLLLYSMVGFLPAIFISIYLWQSDSKIKSEWLKDGFKTSNNQTSSNSNVMADFENKCPNCGLHFYGMKYTFCPHCHKPV
ncbi:MAG: hypothetical protein K9W44_07415 [Candidatus Lokiarchaeota archaeon]|nr:hypothetical protein [Candidatus Harpocratesius repetitus]